MTVEDVSDWLEQRAYRAFERQRAQVDTAKLIATFSAGIAGTLVATALQVKDPSTLDVVAVWLLAATVVFSIAVILLDRLIEADHAHVLEMSEVHGWTKTEVRSRLREATLSTVKANGAVVTVVRCALAIQVAVAVVTGAVAAASLLA